MAAKMVLTFRRCALHMYGEAVGGGENEGRSYELSLNLKRLARTIGDKSRGEVHQ